MGQSADKVSNVFSVKRAGQRFCIGLASGFALEEER